MENKKPSKTKKIVIGVIVVFVLVVLPVMCVNKCTNSVLSDDKKDNTTSDPTEIRHQKQQHYRDSIINVIIEKYKGLIPKSTKETFTAIVTNEYDAYFRMEHIWVQTDIYNKALKKYPNSVIDQDDYCEEHNCQKIDYSDDPITQDFINENDEHAPEEIEKAVSKYYK